MKNKKIIISVLVGVIFFLIGAIAFLRREKEVLIYENEKGEESAVVNNELSSMTSMESLAEEDKPAKESPQSEPVNKESSSNKVEKETTAEINPLDKEESDLVIKKRKVSWGFQAANSRKIDTIVLHSSYNILGGDEYSVDMVIEEYRQYSVAAHYLIDRTGSIWQLVSDGDIAYHAGESQVPDGRTGVNNFSVGIELLNTKEDKFTKAQYQAVNDLIDLLKAKYPIKYILGHNQIAPGRKTDPWNMDWDKITDLN
ncbi:MAG: N-acetylmuramoyl-L-alanine amidase [Candidatus Moraniibacteriota bacterium]